MTRLQAQGASASVQASPVTKPPRIPRADGDVAVVNPDGVVRMLEALQAELRYLVGSDHGCLGAIGCGSAALYLEGRDQWMGWTQAQRMEHLPRVLNMNRFLIRPGVRCENLASQVLGLCARRVPEDFECRYGLRPWLLESFVDRSQYDGCSYTPAHNERYMRLSEALSSVAFRSF